jgi:hypothetical protein
LQSGHFTELPSQVALYTHIPKEMFQGVACTFGQWFDDGVFDLKSNTFLNDQFPDIKPITVKELLDKAWKKA